MELEETGGTVPVFEITKVKVVGGASDLYGFTQRLKPASLFQAWTAALKRCSTQKLRRSAAVGMAEFGRCERVPARAKIGLEWTTV